MSQIAPLQRIAVGIVVERRKASSPWIDVIWRTVAVLGGVPDTAPWTELTVDGDTATFYAGTAEIALYRTESDSYRRNLASGAPAVWVALQPTWGAPPYTIACVTADPAEGEGLTEAGEALVDSVAMPESVREVLAGFVAEHPVEEVFHKRTRDRADPEALGRRAPRSGTDDER